MCIYIYIYIHIYVLQANDNNTSYMRIQACATGSSMHNALIRMAVVICVYTSTYRHMRLCI